MEVEIDLCINNSDTCVWKLYTLGYFLYGWFHFIMDQYDTTYSVPVPLHKYDQVHYQVH